MTDHIKKIVEREFVKTNDKSFNTSRYVRCYDKSKLTALLLEAAEPYRKDAERIEFLQKTMIAADFAYGEFAETVLVFKMPDIGISVNLRSTIDAAIAAAEGK